MPLMLFNSFGNKLEEFKPIKNGFVGIYTCGPTVYNSAHIGNFRAYVWEDLLKRYLLFKGFKVRHVMNLTDVDDKIIKNAIEKGMTIHDFTAPFKKAFFEDIKTLNILPADVYPAATDYIKEMEALIKKLMDRGLAYRGEDGCIYFSIKKFDGYGKLAGIETKNLKSGARIKQDEYGKEGIGDFALWKAWDENDGNVFWDSIFGRGRPGWHIECSAMSSKLLGGTFDIHCGGVDNKFPHHENEIAQSEGASGKKFVNYWLHCEHLIVNGQKMSKSKGNFYTLRDLVNQNLNPSAIRYVLINSHYRQPLNFTIDSVKDAEKTLAGLNNLIQRLKLIQTKSINSTNSINSANLSWSVVRTFELTENGASGVGVRGEAEVAIDLALNSFVDAMDNDLNLPKGMGAIFDFTKKLNKLIDEGVIDELSASKALDFLKKIDSVLGVMDFGEKRIELTSEQKRLIKLREDARAKKDWKKSDEIRDLLKKQGVGLVDNKDGSTDVKSLN